MFITLIEMLHENGGDVWLEARCYKNKAQAKHDLDMYLENQSRFGTPAFQGHYEFNNLTEDQIKVTIKEFASWDKLIWVKGELSLKAINKLNILERIN